MSVQILAIYTGYYLPLSLQYFYLDLQLQTSVCTQPAITHYFNVTNSLFYLVLVHCRQKQIQHHAPPSAKFAFTMCKHACDKSPAHVVLSRVSLNGIMIIIISTTGFLPSQFYLRVRGRKQGSFLFPNAHHRLLLLLA